MKKLLSCRYATVELANRNNERNEGTMLQHRIELLSGETQILERKIP
jgi:hypothetical protein